MQWLQIFVVVRKWNGGAVSGWPQQEADGQLLISTGGSVMWITASAILAASLLAWAVLAARNWHNSIPLNTHLARWQLVPLCHFGERVNGN